MTNMTVNEEFVGIIDGRTSYWYRMEQIVNALWLPFIGVYTFTAYATLCGQAERPGGRVEIDKMSKKELAKASAMSNDKMIECLNHLLELGFIQMTESPSPASRRLGITSKIRVLNAPLRMTQTHIDYGLDKGLIKGVATPEEYFEKYVMFKWLFEQEEEPVDDGENWIVPSIEPTGRNIDLE